MERDDTRRMQGEVILSSCPWSSFFVLVLSQQQPLL